MKHRIRKTGEIIEVISFNDNIIRNNNDYINFINSKGEECKECLNYYWDLEEIEEPNNINWEQRTFDLAKELFIQSGLNIDICIHNAKTFISAYRETLKEDNNIKNKIY